jgi:glycine/D-amino acid oxidase-like deaminating enzyme
MPVIATRSYYLRNMVSVLFGTPVSAPRRRPPAAGLRHDAHGYWVREAGAAIVTAPFDGDVVADVVIIGGGYAGLWAAWAIREQDPGARVVVLEARGCGDGPSGRNAGFVNSMWHRIDLIAARAGEQAALAVCREVAESVDAIGRWARERGVDIWFSKGGQLKAASSPAQAGRWQAAVETCARLGVDHEYRVQSPEEVRSRCASPRFDGGAFMPQAATVQPARLVLALRDAVLEAGVAVHERSPARRLTARPAGGVEVKLANGARVRAERALVATGAAAAGFRPLRNRLTVGSTHMVITEPVPDLLDEIGWTGGESIATLGSYLHYLRTTPDGRIAFGMGGGRLAYGGRLGERLEVDPASVGRVHADLLDYFPGLRGRRVEHAWGGPIDVSPDSFPVIETLADGRTHCVYGFSGNGVGMAHLTGRILAELVLDRRGDLTRLAVVDSPPGRVPPEPLRFLGGSAVGAALMRKERREAEGRPVDALTRALVGLPGRMGIHV